MKDPKHWHDKMAVANVTKVHEAHGEVYCSVLFCGVCGSHLVDVGFEAKTPEKERLMCCRCGWTVDVFGLSIGRCELPIETYLDAVVDVSPKPAVFRRGADALALWEKLGEYIRASLFHADRPDGCVYCGSLEGLTADHQLPLKRGGDNHVSNLSIACRSCNARKGELTPEEWAESKRIMGKP